MTPSAADIALLWRAGKLSWKLHSHQRKLYKHFWAWRDTCAAKWTAAKEGAEAKFNGRFVRTYYASCARRYGKDYFSCVVAIEECIRRKGAVVLYGTAQAKDIASIVVPLIELILEDCPPHLKPKYKNAFQGAESGYHFPNGSILKIIGIERNPDALRGRWADLVILSEAAFVDKLEYTVTSVLNHMFQGRPHACLLLNSTPPVDPGHEITSEFRQDCIDRDAFFHATIRDNPRLSEAEINAEIAAAGGIDSPKCRRELFAEEVRLEERVVIPEFDAAKHVRDFRLPRFGFGYTVLDPGFRDLCAVTCLVHDFERDKLLVVGEWFKPGAGTVEIAEAIRKLEATSFAGMRAWDGARWLSGARGRWSDTDLRLISDLHGQFGLKFAAANKEDADAALHSLRAAVQQGKIEFHPRCERTVETFRNQAWDKNRIDFARSNRLGHGDLLDTVKYGWRMFDRRANPNPPPGVLLSEVLPEDARHIDPSAMRTRASMRETLEKVMPGRWRRRR